MRMLTIGSKFRQIVFSQPRRVFHRLEAKIGFSLSPQASPFVALMHQLEVGVSEHVESSLRISGVDEETRSPFGQPFVIESRNGVEPTRALPEGFRPQRSESFIPFDHYLGVK